jgi:hypothetical protein
MRMEQVAGPKHIWAARIKVRPDPTEAARRAGGGLEYDNDEAYRDAG